MSPIVRLLLIAVVPLSTVSRLVQAQGRSDQPSYTQAAGRAGVERYAPGTWGIVKTDVVNPSEDEAETLATVAFERESGVQFGRRIWIPARATRSTWYPVRPPQTSLSDLDSWRTRSLLFDVSGSREEPITGSGGRLHQEGLLSVKGKGPLTALLSDRDDEDVVAAARAMRLNRDLSARLVRLESPALLPTVESLGALDQLIVSGDRVGSNAAACLSIRQWLHRGGRLWILLDQVDPATASALLGDAFDGTIADRVDLIDLRIEPIDGPGEVRSGQLREFEQPVEMVRLIASDLQVTHTVNGWPAALWKQVGRGEVLITTVNPRGWLRDRTEEDVVLQDPEGSVTRLADEPFRDLAFRFLNAPPPAPLDPPDLEQFVSGQIGYEIIDRRSVAGVLGTFCFVLLGSGLLLAWYGRLEHFGWTGPLVAVGAALLLLLLGKTSREAVPPTIGIGQVVESIPDSGEIHTSGMLVLYNQESSSGSLGSQEGGIFWPEMEDEEGKIRRIIWTDRDEWHWQNLTLPPGLRRAAFRQSRKLESPLLATASFGPEGMTGTLQRGPFREIADSLIALPARRHLSVRLDEQGRFTAGPDDVLAPGQFITGNMLSSQQQSRRAVYERLLSERLLSERPESSYPSVPTLLTWAKPLEMGFALPADAQRIGAALLAVPLRFDRPPPGTSVTVPSPFIPYRTAGRGAAATYDNDRRKWLGPFVKDSRMRLRFQLPAEVLPLRVDRAVLSVDINAPSRELEILAYQDDEPRSLASRWSPLGRLRFEVDDTDFLRIDADGGLLLGISVQGAADLGSSLVWKINDVNLEVQGQTLESKSNGE